jgi:hypothetical protein
MCSLFIFTSMAFAGYQASGGSVSGSNGLYCETGEIYNDRPVYQIAGTDWELFYFGGNWWIDDERGYWSSATYWVPSSALTPPLSGWLYNVKGQPPGPTLSEQVCSNSIPTMNEWGMIILSLFLAGISLWFIRQRKMTS